jgi:hypothetical protein
MMGICFSSKKRIRCTVLNVYFSRDWEAFVCNKGPSFPIKRGHVLSRVNVRETEAEVLKKLHSSHAVPLQQFYNLKQNFALYIPGLQEGYVSPRANFKLILSDCIGTLRIFKDASNGKWRSILVTDTPLESPPSVIIDGVVILPLEKVGTETWDTTNYVIA